MSKNISLLDLLQREKWAISDREDAENIFKAYEKENLPYLSEAKRKYAEKRDKATKELEDVRREIRAYFKDVLNL